MTTINIQALTKEQVRELANKLNAVLAQFGIDNNMSVGKADIRYTDVSMDVKISMSTKDANPHDVDPRFLKDLRSRGWQHGLTDKMVGTQFTGKGGVYKFLGMRASKLVARNIETGMDYTFNAEVVAPTILKNFAA